MYYFVVIYDDGINHPEAKGLFADVVKKVAMEQASVHAKQLAVEMGLSRRPDAPTRLWVLQVERLNA